MLRRDFGNRAEINRVIKSRAKENPDESRLRRTGIDGTRIFIQKEPNGRFLVKGLGRVFSVEDSSLVATTIEKIVEERFG